jgi:uncharacterized protein YraI
LNGLYYSSIFRQPHYPYHIVIITMAGYRTMTGKEGFMARRFLFLLTIVIVAICTTIAFSFNTAYAEDANAWADNTINLRGGPGTNFEVLSVLPTNTAVVIEARTADTSWILVHVAGGGARGWGLTSLFRRAPNIKLASFPVSNETVAAGSQPPAGQQQNNVQAPQPGATPDLAKVPVYTIPSQPVTGVPTGAINAPVLPVITSAIRNQMRVVYRRGQLLGNNPHVFSKVGDCHTDHPYFFEMIGNGKYNLGQYGALQDVINYFMVSPREGAGNSFNNRSMAAHSAFTSGAVLDWQESLKVSDQCNPQESPLRCEIRRSKPAVMLIMFGVVDVITMSPADFNKFMRIIVQDAINFGVIPVLSTSAENPSSPNSRLFNQIVVKIAREKYLPLVNLQAALDPLPSHGLDGDGIHLTRPSSLDNAAVFNDENLKAGYTMRNLVMLQTLDIIMRKILN